MQTSTTNIGAYMWSAVAAERLGIIGHAELVSRLEKTIATVERMERHQPSGQYYNWYDHRTGEKLTIWPPTGEPRTPVLSSVDNAWLATGLRIVRNTVPELSAARGAIYESMDFELYYVPSANRIMFHYVPSTGERGAAATTRSSRRAGSRTTSGSRRKSCRARRTTAAGARFPDDCGWSWQETRPVGFNRSYAGVDVYDGAYRTAIRA